MVENQVYNYFRDYDPSIGRYTQSDPIGLQGGLNTYTYAYDDPANLTDPKGLYVPADDPYCDPRWPGCRLAPATSDFLDPEFQECYASCRTERYYICTPWTLAGTGIGAGLTGLSGAASPAIPVGGAVGGFLGGQACSVLFFEKSCIEECRDKNQCESIRSN